MWYPISFLATSAFLVLWFYFKENLRAAYLFRQLTLFSLAFYAVTIGVTELEWSQKWVIYSKDLMTIAAAAGFFALIRKQKFLFWLFFILFIGIFIVFYKKELPIKSFETTEVTLNQPDKNGELLLELEELSTIQPIVAQYNLDIAKAFSVSSENEPLTNWYIIDIPTAHENQLDVIASKLKELGANVEQNEVIHVNPMKASTINSINKKFGVNDPGLEHLWGFEVMEVDRLYNTLSKGKIKPQKKATIAILDTGVDAAHEDLKANYISTKTAYDRDERGHGTHCAGIAGAVSNNGVGVASLAPSSDFVQITSIKVLNNFGIGTQKTIIDGMIEAADEGVDVISMSLGSYSTDERQRAYNQAVKYCNQKGVIVVVAAGNSNIDARSFSPANSDGVITVSAINPNLEKANFSNEVNHLKMGVAAPGVNIYSTIPKNKYISYNGTSMATPYVAGLIGLMKSIRPSLTTQQAFDILNFTGKNTNDTEKTGKIILPYAAISQLLD
jgi:thermitase